MCELFAMSASQPTDVNDSLAVARAEHASKNTKLAEVPALRKRVAGEKSEALGDRGRH